MLQGEWNICIIYKYVSGKKNTRENVGLLLNVSWDIVTWDMEKQKRRLKGFCPCVWISGGGVVRRKVEPGSFLPVVPSDKTRGNGYRPKQELLSEHQVMCFFFFFFLF